MKLSALLFLLRFPREPLLSKIWQRYFIVLIFVFAALSGFGQLATPELISGLPQQVYSDTSSRITRPVTLNYAPASVSRETKSLLHSDAVSTRNNNPTWGVSKQISTHTWSIQVGQDNHEATAHEIFTALNLYRQAHGSHALQWSDALAGYAHDRAAAFARDRTLDDHRGFMDFVNNKDGFQKLGFAGLGENSSYGFTLEGVHLIEWVYAGDKSHDDNQLSNEWDWVGIGVSDTSTDLVFGGNQL
jgi:uncharacterized protein YkwD